MGIILSLKKSTYWYQIWKEQAAMLLISYLKKKIKKSKKNLLNILDRFVYILLLFEIKNGGEGQCISGIFGWKNINLWSFRIFFNSRKNVGFLFIFLLIIIFLFILIKKIRFFFVPLIFFPIRILSAIDW